MRWQVVRLGRHCGHGGYSLGKLLVALAGGLSLAVMAFGVIGSAAWFTDQSTVPISATSGQLDIRAEVGEEGGSATMYDPTGVPLVGVQPRARRLR